ncbi:cytochrome-c peroxidase [Caminibacter pacificus]|jgi:cytochrome c peroxidase
MFKRLIVFFSFVLLYAEPVSPIPLKVKYNEDKALLGKMLFFDPILSADNKVSCASCHSPKHGGADNKRFSIGVFGRVDKPMNSPTVYNAVFNCWQFWNGRAKNLKQQAFMANTDPDEMGMTPEKVEEKLNKNNKYKKLFSLVYKKDYISYDMVLDAIAEFEKALITPNCRFDKYLRGVHNAITEQEKRGYFLFKSYGCITCHNGKNLGGNSFQKLGVLVVDVNIIRGKDRYEVTHLPYDKYVYKVPTLRNIALTAPYFHDGSVKTLKEAIVKMGIFNLGVKIPAEDVEDIEAFLKTLTGETPEIIKNMR